MRVLLLCSLFTVSFFVNGWAQATSIVAPERTFGMGFQVASTSFLLFSWQVPDDNWTGARSYRIEPLIGGSYSYSESTSPTYTRSTSLTLGVGYSRLWRVGFDHLYFNCGPRLTVTGNRSSSESAYDSIVRTSQYITTALSINAGPEYALWESSGPRFTCGGFGAIGVSIRGRAKSDPPGSNSSWSLAISTSTGIILRYYFM